MATGGNNWRSLSTDEKFSYLLNHFESPENLASVLGVRVQTLSPILDLLNDEQVTRSKFIKAESLLNKLDTSGAIANARHRMTDAVRRRETQARSGRFESPLARSGPATIQPERYQVQYEPGGPLHKSKWLSYHVEHLPIEQIMQVARDLFNVYRDTGQFNVFRFEYIAAWVEYFEETRTGRIQDAGLREQAKTTSIIKLSSNTFPPLAEFDDDEEFDDYFSREWSKKIASGAIRITDLVWADMEIGRSAEKLKRAAHDKKRGSDGKRQPRRKPKPKRKPRR